MIQCRMMNFIELSVSVFVLWKTVGCQNANLTALPATETGGDSITLICNYIRTSKVTAVSWFNGSNSDALILTPGSIIPECDVFLTINTSYDPTRISYTCNEATNTYTLKINPVGTVDNNVKWSCTFQDPQPDAKRAEYTIHLTAIRQPDMMAMTANAENTTKQQKPCHLLSLLVSVLMALC